jgi:hypothetical protein
MRAVWLRVAVVGALAIFLGCTTAKTTKTDTEKEELYGSWVNKEFDGEKIYQTHSRWDFNSDETWASYVDISSKSPKWKGPYSITDKWLNNNGDVWYKMTWKNEISGTNGFGLILISNSGSTFEAAYSQSRYPEKINRDSVFWWYTGVLYRSKTDVD